MKQTDNNKLPEFEREGIRKHRFIIWTLLILMIVEWIFLFINSTWLSLFLVSLIIVTLFVPFIMRKRMEVDIPAEFHLMAVLFAFASLYLGEVHDFYNRLWWWDVALHATAGLLMGVLGFLLVYILNESKRVELDMKPGFIALFAFMFAITIGTIWEIFEFFMDQMFGLNMQKTMLGDPSGLTDTMWDMIVNSLGGLIVSLSGWWYLKRRERFYIKSLIQKFIIKNPKLFRK
ncbi:MAG: hypothetical protein WD513_02330 [Balneolaceae bacterium]